jgi:serine/threonine protein kinase
VVKLIDFGVAKVLKKEDKESFTTGVKGTVDYLSPEIALKKLRSTEAIDLFASDMWALGITIYKTLLFSHPVQREKGDTPFLFKK